MKRNPKNIPGHRFGFTLVELLVTITIIVVLASVSFVVFRSVMASARATACVNNIKQILATHNLLAQETGFIVHPWASAVQGSELRNWSEFHTILLSEDFGWLQPGPDVSERMRSMEHLCCPTAYALRKGEMAGQDDHRGWRTYGLNQKIGRSEDPDPALRAWTDGARTLAEVVSPEKLVLVSEAGWEQSRNRYPGGIGPEAGYAGFHGGGFHVGYLDGHVERHTADTFLLAGKTLPNGKVGRWTNPEFSLMWRGRLTPREVEE